MFGSHLLIIQEEPSVHVLTLALIRVSVVAVQVLCSNVHAGSNTPAKRADGLDEQKNETENAESF